MIDQGVLARLVALVLTVELRDRLVRLVDDDDVVAREVVEQRVGHLTRGPTVEMTRVVLDPGAHADLAQHLEVVGRAHAQPLRLEQLALLFEPGEPFVKLRLDALDGSLHVFVGRDVVRGREEHQPLQLLDDLPRQRVDRSDALHLVAEE